MGNSRFQFAFAFQKGSAYFDAFWYQQNKMRERGSAQQILRKYEAAAQVGKKERKYNFLD